jgi:hypothetical protein
MMDDTNCAVALPPKLWAVPRSAFRSESGPASSQAFDVTEVPREFGLRASQLYLTAAEHGPVRHCFPFSLPT